MKHDMIFYIGRFQLLHNGQINTIKSALEMAHRVLILIGSSNRSISFKNPFTAAEREEVIRAVAKKNGWEDRIIIRHVPDIVYSSDESAWFKQVESIVREEASKAGCAKVAMIGHDKDASSYYLKKFEDFELIKKPNYRGLNSTDLRAEFFDSGNIHPELTDKEVIDWMDKWKSIDVLFGYDYLKSDLSFTKAYQEKYEDKIYVTADALVTCGDKILLVKRKNFPGMFLYAMPGGFVNPGETFLHAAKRELYEETMLDSNSMPLTFVSSKMFDDPNRDPRRHIISMVHHFNVPLSESGLPPLVIARDDALHAEWVTLKDVFDNPSNFFIDHWFIIKYMLEDLTM